MPELDELRMLEESLWRGETRYDAERLNPLVAPDYFEFGRSGRRYERAEMVVTIPGLGIDATLYDFEIRPLSPTLAQCTYVSENRLAEHTEWAYRSSIWDCASGAWQLRFHQGTPTKPRPGTP